MPKGIPKNGTNAGWFKKDTHLRENHPNWKGGKIIGSDGYVLSYNPKHPFSQTGGYVREHRLVIERKLGRFLNPQETVHHLNGDKQDNRIENLILFANHYEHMRHHVKENSCFGFRKGHKRHINSHTFKKGEPPPSHKQKCKCFRCCHKSPNPFVKNL